MTNHTYTLLVPSGEFGFVGHSSGAAVPPARLAARFVRAGIPVRVARGDLPLVARPALLASLRLARFEDRPAGVAAAVAALRSL